MVPCRSVDYLCHVLFLMQLTRLLEDSLGSSSKCVMVVNVSPAMENVPETKCSLEFASRARKVSQTGMWIQSMMFQPVQMNHAYMGIHIAGGCCCQ